MRSNKIKKPVVEAITFAIAKSDWTRESARSSIQSLFRRRQSWTKGLVDRVFERYPERVKLESLLNFLSSDLVLKQTIKSNNIKPIDVSQLLGGSCIAGLDWQMPTFENCGQLASQLGVTPRCLDWLAGNVSNKHRKPQHYRTKWIKKRTEGFRLIEAPKSQLKNVQRLILQNIVGKIPIHYAAYGFCRKRDVVSFAQQHVGQEFCLKMDLRDFFLSVSAARVHGIFRNAGYNRNVVKMLTRLCTTETDQEVVEQQRPTGILRGAFRESRLYLPGHLPQGAPTSPALANIAAFHFDRRLNGLASAAGVKYSRYADDLLFSGPRWFARQAKQFSITVGTIAIEEGLEVNFRKTRFQHASQRQFATGIVLNRRTNLKRADYDRLKAILNNCVRHGPASQNHECRPNFREHLLGKINWAARLNQTKADKLVRLFQQIQWS